MAGRKTRRLALGAIDAVAPVAEGRDHRIAGCGQRDVLTVDGVLRHDILGVRRGDPDHPRVCRGEASAVGRLRGGGSIAGEAGDDGDDHAGDGGEGPTAVGGQGGQGGGAVLDEARHALLALLSSDVRAGQPVASRARRSRPAVAGSSPASWASRSCSWPGCPASTPDRSAQRRLARCPDLTLSRGWAPVGRRGIPATYGPVG